MACSDEAAVVAFWERQRRGDCPACVHCGDTAVYMMHRRGTGERDGRFRWRCRRCGQRYTVEVGTVMESSNIALRHWTLAFWLITAGKRGYSAKQLQRMTGLSYESCLFLLHWVRHAMADDCPAPLAGTVEAADAR